MRLLLCLLAAMSAIDTDDEGEDGALPWQAVLTVLVEALGLIRG